MTSNVPISTIIKIASQIERAKINLNKIKTNTNDINTKNKVDEYICNLENFTDSEILKDAIDIHTKYFDMMCGIQQFISNETYINYNNCNKSNDTCILL